MRRNAPAADSKLGEQMRELMPQSAIDFGLAVCAETTIEQHTQIAILRAASCAPETTRPFDLHPRGKKVRAVVEHECLGRVFQVLVAAGRFAGSRCREVEFELAARLVRKPDPPEGRAAARPVKYPVVSHNRSA